MAYLYTFLISMVPILELRASVIYGAANGLEWYIVIPISIIGNMLPIPFILLFIRKILAWMKTTKHFARFALWLERKAEKHSKRVLKYAFFGLVLFGLVISVSIIFGFGVSQRLFPIIDELRFRQLNTFTLGAFQFFGSIVVFVLG